MPPSASLGVHQALVTLKVRRLLGRSVTREVGRCGNQVAAPLAKGMRTQRRVDRNTDADGQVVALLHEVDVPIAEDQLEFDALVLEEEVGNRGNDETLSEDDRNTHADPSAKGSGLLANFSDGRLVVGHDHRSPLVEASARFSHVQ